MICCYFKQLVATRLRRWWRFSLNPIESYKPRSTFAYLLQNFLQSMALHRNTLSYREEYLKTNVLIKRNSCILSNRIEIILKRNTKTKTLLWVSDPFKPFTTVLLPTNLRFALASEWATTCFHLYVHIQVGSCKKKIINLMQNLYAANECMQVYVWTSVSRVPVKLNLYLRFVLCIQPYDVARHAL